MVFNLIMFCKLGTIHFNFLSPAAFLFWAVKFANCMLIRYIIATDVLEQWQLYWFSLLKLISHTVLLLCSCWVHKCTCTCTCVTPKPLCVKDVNVATTQFSEFLYMDVILYFLLGRIGVLMLLSCFLMVLWLKGGRLPARNPSGTLCSSEPNQHFGFSSESQIHRRMAAGRMVAWSLVQILPNLCPMNYPNKEQVPKNNVMISLLGRSWTCMTKAWDRL